MPLTAGTGRESRGSADRLRPWLPWTDDSGRPWRGWTRLPLAAPFVGLYLLVSWTLFLLTAERENATYYKIETDDVRGYLFRIPKLSEDFLGALRDLLTAPILNHDSTQLIYVTVLLLLFGIVFEVKEGTRMTAAVFFGTTFAAAFGAGALLHLIYPEISDGRFFERAWNRTWSGGSASCFGLMGALAARARRPWLLLGLFALWEINIALWYLKNYTPAFHLIALAVGFGAMRLRVRGRRPGHG